MDLTIVDVFAERPLEGNQLAVVRQLPDLSDTQMQAIAREMNFSETTFVTTDCSSQVGCEGPGQVPSTFLAGSVRAASFQSGVVGAGLDGPRGSRPLSKGARDSQVDDREAASIARLIAGSPDSGPHPHRISRRG